MMIRAWLGSIFRIYFRATGALAALAALLVVALIPSGVLSRDRLRAAADALRGKAPAAAPAAGPLADLDTDETRRQAGVTIEVRRREAEELERFARARMAQAQTERDRMETERKLLDEAAAKLRKEREDLAAEKLDAEIESNLPIFLKLEGASVLELMKRWDDARIVRYLRAMKPSKAAEVLDAMRSDPRFEDDFRRRAPDAPEGAMTRVELIMEEFKKAP